MKRSSLSTTVLDQIKTWRWDRIIEKHEGPERWRARSNTTIRSSSRSQVIQFSCRWTASITRTFTILRCIASEDHRTLTIFLKDTTYVTDPRDEYFAAGYVAVCERFPGQDFYVAILYHEWFMVENR